MKANKINTLAKKIRRNLDRAKETEDEFERGHLIQESLENARKINEHVEPEVPKVGKTNE